jgi:sugar phosphate isomerase/epimerase
MLERGRHDGSSDTQTARAGTVQHLDPQDAGSLVGMTVALSWLDGEAAAEELASIGFTAVEVHLFQLAPAIPGVAVLEAHAEAMGGFLRGRGLVVSSLNAAGAPGFEPVAGDREAAIETLAGQLRVAAALGAPRLICWDGRAHGDAAEAPVLLADVVGGALARSGLTVPPDVSVELHPFTFALADGVLEETARALRQVGAGICLDFCHLAVALGPDFAGRLTDEVIEATNHIHLADSDCASSELHFPLGEGVLEVEEIARLFDGRRVVLAWDMFGWPAPRRAMREGLARYAEIVAAHARTLGPTQ